MPEVSADTTLRLERDSQGDCYFVFSNPVEGLNPSLHWRFDTQGILKIKSFNGEFFLDNYENSSQFDGEKVYRYEAGEYKDITFDIKHLREKRQG